MTQAIDRIGVERFRELGNRPPPPHDDRIWATIIAGVTGMTTREFAEDRNTHSQRFYRIANEVPTLLMIVVVILAVVKPF